MKGRIMRNNHKQPTGQMPLEEEHHQDDNSGHTQESTGPDYIAMQYRQVKMEDGWRTRKERIGAAFINANGSICFRPQGQQLIDNDVYLFPTNDEPA